jgi:hypothetical protein
MFNKTKALAAEWLDIFIERLVHFEVVFIIVWFAAMLLGNYVPLIQGLITVAAMAFFWAFIEQFA